MTYRIEELKKSVIEAIRSASGSDAPEEKLLEYPSDTKNGDIAFPCFVLAKELQKAPPAIATDLVEKMDLPEGVETVVAAGPYLNFVFSAEALVEEVVSVTEAKACYGTRKTSGQKVLIEYVSPNNNKPLHLGHIRCGLVGESVSNLLETQGNEVIRTLLLNDRGLAIAKSMVAYMKWGEGVEPQEKGMKGDRFVGDMYVLFDKKSKEDPLLEGEAHEVIRKWEEGDAETRALWKKMDAWVGEGQEASFKKLGFHFDARYRESEIYKEGKALVEEGLKKGVFVKDSESNAITAPLEDVGLQDKVVLRSDGTSLYITQDLVLAKRKEEDHVPDLSIIVTAKEQNLHFQQLFAILKKFGYDWADRQQHLSYGYVTLPEGRMKSREGNVVEADDLVDALDADAAIEIKQRHGELDGQVLVNRAHQLAMGALKFHFLQIDIAQDMVFNPKESLAFNGRTGPYVQYMHARTCSILRKAGEGNVKGFLKSFFGKNDALSLTMPEEKELALMLSRYPELLTDASVEMRPSVLANYLYETSRLLAAFYEKCHVLNEKDKAVRAFRLKLVEATGIVLKNGLAILGIDAPEEM